MRVCFIIEYYPPHIGGGEVLFQGLAEGLVRRGHRCDVVTARLPGTRGHEKVDGVEVHRVPVPRVGDRYWFTLLSLPPALRVARKADVIHTMTYNAAPAAWLVSRILGKPVVLLAYEVLGKRWSEAGLTRFWAALYRLLENLVLQFPFHAYSCISRATLQSLERWGVPRERLFLSYPGIDHGLFRKGEIGKREEVRRSLGLGVSSFVYLYFGRPGVVKGVEYLVEAIPLVEKRVPNSTAVLILSRKPAAKYRELTAAIRRIPSGRVILLDPVPRERLPDYIGAADCVVVPSLSEGFGFTCVEACTVGVPVVATRVGSLPEVVFGRHVLVEPRSAAALAEGIERIFRGEWEVAQERSYRWEETVERHIVVYEGLIRKGSASGNGRLRGQEISS